MSKKILAVIPARGGSKRLKNKNILPLLGKPMIAYTIESAVQAKIFDDVLVSTDSAGIAKVAQEFGAQVPFLRESQFADDHTPVSVATIQALKQMEIFKNKQYDTVIQLMPNCPCRTAQDICRAHDRFLKSKAVSQISVFSFGWMNPWWAMKLDESEKPHKLFPEAYKKRSQDLEKLYCPTGAIWIAQRNLLVNDETFYMKGFRVFSIDWQSAVDIDEQDDFDMAKAVLMMRKDNS